MALNRRIWRALLENLAQYSGSLALIVLSTLLFTTMTLVGSNLQRLADGFALNNRQEDASFTTDRPLSDLAALEAGAGALVEEGRSFDAALPGGVTLRVFRQNEKVNLPGITSGRALAATGEILLYPTFASAHGYQAGDVLTIAGRPFSVAGTVSLPNYIYPLKADTDLMYSQQSFGIAVINQADFDTLGLGSSFYAIRFNEAGQPARERAARVQSLAAEQGVRIVQWTDTTDNKRVSNVTLKLEALQMMSRAMPAALLLLTSILVGTVIARMIQREAPVIGALYALGYRKAEIRRHYLSFPLVLALAGGLTGTALGALCARPMLDFMLTAFPMPVERVDYPAGYLALSVLLPVFFLGISSALVLANALRRSPVELMKGEQGQTRVNFLERALKLERLSFALKFELRGQLRSLARLVFLLAGCAAATMLLLYGFTIKSSLDSLSAESLAGTFHFQNEYIYKELHFDATPAGTEPFSPELFYAAGDGQREFFVNGIRPDSRLLSFVDRAGAPLSTDQVLITRPLAERLKVEAGDSVTLERKSDGQTFSVRIDQVADTYVGKYIFMPLADYNRLFGLPEGSYLGVWSPGPLDIAPAELYSQKSIEDSLAALDESTQTIQIMVFMYSAVAFLIGLIVIYLVTAMIVEENRTTISLMKIFGYRRKEVNALVLNSSTFGVVAGYALGVPLILATIGGLLRALDNSVGITLPVRINPLYILVGFLVVMLAFELSKLLCRKKVAAVPMGEALKAGME